MIAVFAACGTLMTAMQALKAMIALYTRDKAIAEFQALGGKPKSSHMASRQALQSSGMLDE